MWPQYASDNCQTSKAFRPGKAHFITERTPIRHTCEKNALAVDVVALLHLVQDEHEGRRVPRKPGRAKRFGAHEHVAATFGVGEPGPQKILVVPTPPMQCQQ